MSTAPAPDVRHCPACGEVSYGPAASRCWLCHEPLDAAAPPAPAKPPAEYGLRVWFVLVPVLAIVCYGLFLDAPGLAVALAVLATPVMIHTLVKILRRRGQGRPMTAEEVAGTLLASLGVVIMLGVSATVAFFATCFAICFGYESLNQVGRGGEDKLIIASIGGGAVVGILAAVGTYRLLRRVLPRGR